MARGKRKKKHGGGGPAVINDPALLLERLAEVADAITAAPDAASPAWGEAHKLLLRLKADPGSVGRAVATRDVPGLQRLVAVIRGEQAAPKPEAPAPAPAVSVPHETLKKAMRAFRKRVKLIRLDHESRLGVGPMSGGRKADIDAIIPPMEFPTEVWEALVAEGRLRRMGKGFYGLVDDAPDA